MKRKLKKEINDLKAKLFETQDEVLELRAVNENLEGEREKAIRSYWNLIDSLPVVE